MKNNRNTRCTKLKNNMRGQSERAHSSCLTADLWWSSFIKSALGTAWPGVLVKVVLGQCVTLLNNIYCWLMFYPKNIDPSQPGILQKKQKKTWNQLQFFNILFITLGKHKKRLHLLDVQTRRGHIIVSSIFENWL